ncbi:MAG: MBL fold metallo-hydrolase [Desulfobacterales bacterium]|nr:MAG: MBL fold metallo-hydrolase [Desulfobacterales bacterium]
MIINQTGEIIPGLYMLGIPAMPVYLRDGENPAIFDAGLAFLGEAYATAVKEILGPRPPAYCFLTHSHFDHCGSVAVLKAHFPEMRVLAAPRAKEVLGRPNAIKLIRELTRAAVPMVQTTGIDLARYDGFEPFAIDQTLNEGDTVEIAKDLSVQVIETPGHTWDTLSYYIPQERVLFSSESAGQPDQTGYIVSDCLADYDQYFESMLRLSDLDLEVICLGHLMALTGEEARAYIPESMEQCREFRRMVVDCLREEQGDVTKVLRRIRKIEYDTKTGPKQPEPAYLINLEARIKAVKNSTAKAGAPRDKFAKPKPSQNYANQT